MKYNYFLTAIIITSFFSFSHGMYKETVKDSFLDSISCGDEARFDELLLFAKYSKKRLKWGLIFAARDGQSKMVTKLLAAGADINAELHGWTPLMYAIFRERTDIIRQLSDQGATNLTDAQWERMAVYHRQWYKEKSKE